MTLEERERRAYAENDPTAPLLGLALDYETGDREYDDSRVEQAESTERDARSEREEAVDLLRGLVAAVEFGTPHAHLAVIRSRLDDLL